ncbi:hypothetical protein PQQ75_04225 [Paraburkholderia aspalathi]|uniref:hypothetical protein n=1 Tax=Paraburkholderia aspalathi TaxID=1324617 RepID=UPI0038BB9026
MLTAEEIISRLENEARTDGVAKPFVSGRVRVDCEFVRDLAIFSWRIDGRTTTRQRAVQAIDEARRFPSRKALI